MTARITEHLDRDQDGCFESINGQQMDIPVANIHPESDTRGSRNKQEDSKQKSTRRKRRPLAGW